jgi:hypothetical protein
MAFKISKKKKKNNIRFTAMAEQPATLSCGVEANVFVRFDMRCNIDKRCKNAEMYQNECIFLF